MHDHDVKALLVQPLEQLQCMSWTVFAEKAPSSRGVRRGVPGNFLEGLALNLKAGKLLVPRAHRAVTAACHDKAEITPLAIKMRAIPPADLVTDSRRIKE